MNYRISEIFRTIRIREQKVVTMEGLVAGRSVKQINWQPNFCFHGESVVEYSVGSQMKIKTNNERVEGRKEVQEGGDISILTFDSHWCMAESSTTL